MNYRTDSIKLCDCLQPTAAHAELFIVEGDSAAQAVANVRNERFQAVLPMQGKPMNAMKARTVDVDKNELFVALRQALGFHSPDLFKLDACRYEKIVFLFDPDADGIHCGALMLMYFYRRLKPLLDAGRVCLVQAPLVRLSWQRASSDSGETFCYSMAEARRQFADLQAAGLTEIQQTRYRGLASIEHASLARTCIDPRTRKINRLRTEDAEAAIAMFG